MSQTINHIRHLIRKAWRNALLSAFLCLLHAQAQAQPDTIHTLHNVEVEYHTPAQGIKHNPDGTLSLSTRTLNTAIHTFGVADALNLAKMTAGINSGSDYSGGISIDGADYGQTAYSYDGATMFFPYHFGGIFTTLNSNHLASIKISPTTHHPGSSYSAGGAVAAYTDNANTDSLSATASIGIISSDMSVKAPLTSSTSVIASMRASYIDKLYGRITQTADGKVKYGFTDYNLTLIQKINDCARLKISGILSNDHLTFADKNYGLVTTLNWHNSATSINYSHRGDKVDFDQTLSYSRYTSKVGLEMPQFWAKLPSSVYQLAAHGTASHSQSALSVGYRIEYNCFNPQSCDAGGLLSPGQNIPNTDQWLVGSDIAKSWAIANNTLRLQARGIMYRSGSYTHGYIDPEISYQYSLRGNTLHVNLTTSTQFMHFIGLSDIGLASNFYLPATELLKPQRSYGLDATYTTLNLSRDVQLTARAYFRYIDNTHEYTGDILSILSEDYDPYLYTVTTKGYNIGGSLSLNYQFGNISGWGAYSLAIARRKFNDIPHKWVSSNSEPLHTIKAVTQWQINSRLSLSAYFTIASGKPYTPVRAIYIIAGNILTEYGPRNSARLPLYHRLDVSATYMLPKIHIGNKRMSNYINISINNAYGHHNVEMQYFTYNERDNTVGLRQVSSLYRFMPSISYQIQL